MGRAAIRLASLATVLTAARAGGQTPSYYEQTYYPASHNWVFRRTYPSADRLFNAFDYGHGILAEVLATRPTTSRTALEGEHFTFLTRRLLVDPPNLPLEESAIAPTFVKLAPEVSAMFEWAHILHRQIYDIWADDRIPAAKKDARVAEVLRYYRSRPDLAFSSVPKSMGLMEGQYYSRVFRERYPKFNGLIWSYHWLQMGLYDALMQGATPDDRRANVDGTIARFWRMLDAAPASTPRVMPMSAAIAPAFAARYPEAAIIFDNLHALHDVVSDILASPQVPAAKKRSELLVAAARYRDATSFVTTVEEWREMSAMMGVEQMGGVAIHPSANEGRPPR